jgi:TPR repeat protein
MLANMFPTVGRRFAVPSIAALLLLIAAAPRADETSDQPAETATAGPVCTAAATIVSEDPAALVALCRAQAEAGDVQAQYALGVSYYVGVGAPLDYVEAARWYRLAAEQGFVEAQVRMAAMYLMGRGVERDFTQAADWYKRAAEQGDVEAQNALGGLYLTGTGIGQDAREAARWYRLAAEQGDPEAQYFMGAFYYDGNGVTQDYEQAWRWFRLSADQGDLEARFMLGRLYEAGDGVPASAAKAARWYRDAADQGHPRAQAALGTLLAHDRDDLAADRAEAYLWLSLAAAQGVDGASDEREALLLAMTPAELSDGEDRLAAWLGADE